MTFLSLRTVLVVIAENLSNMFYENLKKLRWQIGLDMTYLNLFFLTDLLFLSFTHYQNLSQCLLFSLQRFEHLIWNTKA